MTLQLALIRLAQSAGDAAAGAAYLLRHVVDTLVRAVLFTLAGVGLVLTAVGTALLWVVAATGGVHVEPIVVRWPMPRGADRPMTDRSEQDR